MRDTKFQFKNKKLINGSFSYTYMKKNIRPVKLRKHVRNLQKNK